MSGKKKEKTFDTSTLEGRLELMKDIQDKANEAKKEHSKLSEKN